MVQLLASAFFVAAFLAAAVVLHLIVRARWDAILVALKGELGLSPSAAAARAGTAWPQQRRAAF